MHNILNSFIEAQGAASSSLRVIGADTPYVFILAWIVIFFICQKITMKTIDAPKSGGGLGLYAVTGIFLAAVVFHLSVGFSASFGTMSGRTITATESFRVIEVNAASAFGIMIESWAILAGSVVFLPLLALSDPSTVDALLDTPPTWAMVLMLAIEGILFLTLLYGAIKSPKIRVTTCAFIATTSLLFLVLPNLGYLSHLAGLGLLFAGLAVVLGAGRGTNRA